MIVTWFKWWAAGTSGDSHFDAGPETKMFETTNPVRCNYGSSLAQEFLALPRYAKKTPNPMVADPNAPVITIPTNCWWGNLVHQQPKSGGGPIEPVWSHPYAIRVVPGRGMVVTYPADHRTFGPMEEINPEVKAAKFYFHALVEDMILSAVDLSDEFAVSDWDDFGVSIQLGAVQEKYGKKRERNTDNRVSTPIPTMEASLVSGMAFVSATYAKGTKPSIETTHAIVSINGKPAGAKKRYEAKPGTRLVLGLNNGQFWVIYSDGPVKMNRIDQHKLTAYQAVNSATTVRIARTDPNKDKANQLDVLDPLDVLDMAAGRVVTGGRVRTRSEHRYDLEWETRGIGPLLHYALDHHLNCFVANDEGGDASESDVIAGDPPRIMLVAESATRGKMHGIVRPVEQWSDRCVWALTEPEKATVGFGPKNAIEPECVRDFGIDEELRKEAETEWKIKAKDGSYYFNGKLMQKYASLCLLAHDETVLPLTATDDGEDDGHGDGDGNNNNANVISNANAIANANAETRKRCVEQLSSLWDSFLSNHEWLHPLVYDEVYGGIVSSQAFATKDPWSDFGNTVYNDHHYHYGYWLVAASIFLYLRPDYPSRPELIRKIDTLVRDVANPNPNDPWFPRFRNFDWYLGHSYSHGVTPFADGKDQESVSEEINFHYGLRLWGMATGRDTVRDLGTLMLKINARAARTYFLMDNSKTGGAGEREDSSSSLRVHPPEFLPNRVTGIYFDNKADCTTWFSPERHCIHGIQMIPCSPATPLFRSLSFVRDEWESIVGKLPIITDPSKEQHQMPWQSLLFVNGARIPHVRNEAMEHLKTVPMDDGLSRAWALYMAATTTD